MLPHSGQRSGVREDRSHKSSKPHALFSAVCVTISQSTSRGRMQKHRGPESNKAENLIVSKCALTRFRPRGAPAAPRPKCRTLAVSLMHPTANEEVWPVLLPKRSSGDGADVAGVVPCEHALKRLGDRLGDPILVRGIESIDVARGVDGETRPVSARV